MRENRTKAKLEAGETVWGVFVRHHDPTLAEQLALGRWDFLVFDGEHGTIEPRDLEGLVRATELGGATPLTRVPSHARSAIIRALDTGAQGVHVPEIETVAEAQAAVRAAKYWPEGERGLAYVRPSRYGRQPLAEYVAQSNRETLVAVHIETAGAVERAGEIAGVRGVDVVFIGQLDLSQSLGVPGQTARPEVRAAVERVVEEVTRAGTALGVLVNDAEGARMWRERGARYIALTVEALLSAAEERFFADLAG